MQLNGCYQFGFYDACSVMVRRVLETLIIEAYEHLHRESEIRDAEGNYFMLGELVNRSTTAGGLSIGREVRGAPSKRLRNWAIDPPITAAITQSRLI